MKLKKDRFRITSLKFQLNIIFMNPIKKVSLIYSLLGCCQTYKMDLQSQFMTFGETFGAIK